MFETRSIPPPTHPRVVLCCVVLCSVLCADGRLVGASDKGDEDEEAEAEGGAEDEDDAEAEDGKKEVHSEVMYTMMSCCHIVMLSCCHVGG